MIPRPASANAQPFAQPIFDTNGCFTTTGQTDKLGYRKWTPPERACTPTRSSKPHPRAPPPDPRLKTGARVRHFRGCKLGPLSTPTSEWAGRGWSRPSRGLRFAWAPRIFQIRPSCSPYRQIKSGVFRRRCQFTGKINPDFARVSSIATPTRQGPITAIKHKHS